jgi:serine O-acetyltransferase
MDQRPNFQDDLYRHYGRKERFGERLKRPPELRYLYWFRLFQSTRFFPIKLLAVLAMRRLSRKTLIQIPYRTKIGKGFYIGHTGSVIINEQTIIGQNVNIATGVTIGIENRGERQGCPRIGSDVWIGTNAVIVGKVNIGNDVLIAPLTFVNFDVPDHSIVIGHPAKIVPRSNAVEQYVTNRV